MADIATKELSNHLNVPVRIGEVDIEWFNRLVLYDLYLEDEKGEVLFEADHVSAGLEITPLFEGKLVFSAIRLFGFTFNLNKETPKDKLNLQFVIDAFAKKDTVKKELNVDLRFNTILLKRGHFKYDVASLPYTPDKFNANHIHIKNLNAKISLDALNKDSLHAEIKKMNFEEASGFTLNKLTLEINATRDSAILHNLEMKLPQTNLNIDRAHILKAKVDSLPNLFNQSPIYLDIDPSQVYLKDLSAFVPAFKNFDETLELTAVLSGYVNDITLNQLTLKHSDRMLFIGRMNLKDISDTEKAHITGEVNKLYITTEGISGLANNFSDKPLPQAVRELGTVNFSGKISGHFDHLVAQGKLSTSIGFVQTNVTFGKNKKKNIKAFLKGHISTSPLQLHELLPEGNPLGTTQLQISIDAKRPEKGPFVGNIQANIEEFHFKKYKYQDILISGNFQEKSFEGLLQINDPNGKFSAQGLFLKDGENSKFNFISRLENLRPDNLHLTDKYESPVISGVLNANFTGNNIDNIVGEIQLDSLAFHTAPDSFFLKQLKIEASHDSFNQYLKIKSDIMNGEVSGAYSFATIVPSFMNTLEQYIPALIHTTQKKQQTKENNFSLLLTIENTETLSNTLKLPITLFSQGRITGHYNNQYNRFRLETYLPQFKIGKTFLESGYVVCDNPFDKINLELKATQFNKKGLRNYLNLKVDAKDNIVNTWINWAN
ncbi:MAG: translocation/assembly module TamB, partial [Parabacteroides sp.]|nr:translocation/assembly module TamB [Parabacteroides sp.]